MSTLLLQESPEYLTEPIADIMAFLPRLVGAIVILLVGWLIGRFVAGLVRRIADRIEIDRAVLDTPLGGMLGGTEQAVSNAFGTLAKWFIYALAVLAAANVLAIPLLSQWISRAVTYLPAFIAGLLIILVGFVVADFVGDAIMRTRAATETSYTQWFATGARLFLYFMVLIMGLDTMGVDVQILYVFARALAWGLAIAIAIGAGIALGWGGKDYVSQNIGDWMGRAGRATPSPDESTGTDGGVDESVRTDDDGDENPGTTDGQ